MRRRVPWGSDHSITACRRPPNTAEGLDLASTPPRLTGSPGATNICSMPTRIVEQTQQCPYCLLATVVVTVEQLIEQARGCRRVDRAVEGVVHVADEAAVISHPARRVCYRFAAGLRAVVSDCVASDRKERAENRTSTPSAAIGRHRTGRALGEFKSPLRHEHRLRLQGSGPLPAIATRAATASAARACIGSLTCEYVSRGDRG